MFSLGNKIENLRKAKGISQEKLAELVGVSRQTIYNWETNTIVPNAEKIATLSAVLDCEKTYFYNNDENSQQTMLDEIALSAGVKKPHKAILIASIITSVLLPFLVLVSVMFGFSAMITDPGVIYTTTSGIDIEHFILVLIVTICDLIAVITLWFMFILKNVKYKKYLVKGLSK